MIQFKQYACERELMRNRHRILFNTLKKFLNIPYEKRQYILKLVSTQGEPSFYSCNYLGTYTKVKLSLLEAIEFVESQAGVYYAVDNTGERTYDFIDIPTKKQAVNRRIKYGNRIVFLNFNNFTEYRVNETN